MSIWYLQNWRHKFHPLLTKFGFIIWLQEKIPGSYWCMKYALEVVHIKENYSYAFISDCGLPYLRNETSIDIKISHILNRHYIKELI